MTKKKGRKRGPKPDFLKIKGDWEKSVKKALNKKKPNDNQAKDEK